MSQPDFDDICKFARNLAAQSDGRINIEAWSSGGSECLKIVLTWKRGPQQFAVTSTSIT